MAPARDSVRPVLRATYADFYPDSFSGAGGQAEGYIIDVINTLADSAGYDVRITESRSPRAFLDLLAAGEIDITPFLGLTPERVGAG